MTSDFFLTYSNLLNQGEYKEILKLWAIIQKEGHFNEFILKCFRRDKVDHIIITRLALIKFDFNIQASDQFTPLFYACDNNNLHVVQTLLQNPTVNVNIQISNITPLMFAARAGYDGIVNALLNHPHIDPNLGDNDGVTAFMEACLQRKNIKTVKAFLQNSKVNFNQQNTLGESAFLQSIKPSAFHSDQTEVILMKDAVTHLLLVTDKEIDILCPNKNGQHSLMYALLYGKGYLFLLLAGLLSAKGQYIPPRDNQGKTLLHYALEAKELPTAIIDFCFYLAPESFRDLNKKTYSSSPAFTRLNTLYHKLLENDNATFREAKLSASYQSAFEAAMDDAIKQQASLIFSCLIDLHKNDKDILNKSHALLRHIPFQKDDSLDNCLSKMTKTLLSIPNIDPNLANNDPEKSILLEEAIANKNLELIELLVNHEKIIVKNSASLLALILDNQKLPLIMKVAKRNPSLFNEKIIVDGASISALDYCSQYNKEFLPLFKPFLQKLYNKMPVSPETNSSVKMPDTLNAWVLPKADPLEKPRPNYLLHKYCLQGNKPSLVMTLHLFPNRINEQIKTASSEFQQGETLLHIATRCEHSEIMPVLLKNPSIEVNVTNARGHTPLHIAFFNRDLNCFKLLINDSRIELPPDLIENPDFSFMVMHLCRTPSVIKNALSNLNFSVSHRDQFGYSWLCWLNNDMELENLPADFMETVLSSGRFEMWNDNSDSNFPHHLACRNLHFSNIATFHLYAPDGWVEPNILNQTPLSILIQQLHEAKHSNSALFTRTDIPYRNHLERFAKIFSEPNSPVLAALLKMDSLKEVERFLEIMRFFHDLALITPSELRDIHSHLKPHCTQILEIEREYDKTNGYTHRRKGM